MILHKKCGFFSEKKVTICHEFFKGEMQGGLFREILKSSRGC